MLSIHAYTTKYICELNFHGLRPIHENYAPRKFGAIRYILYYAERVVQRCTLSCCNPTNEIIHEICSTSHLDDAMFFRKPTEASFD